MPDEQGKKILAQKRAEREANNFRTGLDAKSATTATSNTSTNTKYTFEQSIGAGLEVTVGNEKFEIRPFPMRQLKKMSEEFNNYPSVTLAQALLTVEDASDIELVTNKLNEISRLTPGDAVYYLSGEVKIILASIAIGLTDEALEMILNAIVTAIKLWTPLSAEQEELLKNSIDYSQMVDFARKVFLLNSGLRERFAPDQP